ncbi:hypothetical protein J2T57_002554 [Natronocella acetinitrilica]|uniref:Uncharacterized protein n=1 Tax=Natronocella acetinitrilica TaxID=414046 RepID=A0AAE3G5H6_9GAMM|nr:hypothetical protein [Natronocella acetinitrilica]MCP1675404.1 hypothetical protein [Natronocella acetinitrilica]
MYPLTAFLLAASGAMLIGLILVLAWALSRERYYERLLEAREDQYAQALKREGELSAQTNQLLEDQARARLRVQRLEERYVMRGELIRDLGLDPERIEQSRESLLGVLAILRIRIGLLLVSDLNRVALRDVTTAAGGRAGLAFRQLDDKLRGEGGPQHDQQSRQLLREMIDVSHIEKSVSDVPEPMI